MIMRGRSVSQVEMAAKAGRTFPSRRRRAKCLNRSGPNGIDTDCDERTACNVTFTGSSKRSGQKARHRHRLHPTHTHMLGDSSDYRPSAPLRTHEHGHGLDPTHPWCVTCQM